MSNADIVPFDFEGQAVRVIDRAGMPWFVGADVCRCLEIVNSRQLLGRLDDDEKGVYTTDTLGGPQQTGIVSESGVYALIFTSRKPAAKRFRKWVTSEVLPAIRKTGHYERPGAAPARDLPDSEDRREWLNRISVAMRVYGRAAARELWRQSPLPQVSAAALASADTADDTLSCLDRLLDWETPKWGPIRNLIGMAIRNELNENRLASYGLRVNEARAAGKLCIAVVHPRLSEIFRASRWHSDWRRPLREIEGAFNVPRVRFSVSTATSCRVSVANAVAIPLPEEFL